MACKKLPLNMRPPITGYLHHAFALSILSRNQTYLPWLCSNYVQLVSPREGSGEGLNFYLHPAFPVALCPLLDVEWLNRDIVARTRGGPGQFVRDCIDADYCVQLYADEFNIPRRRAHRRMHYVHEVLVFGYDDAGRAFDIVGYDERGAYAASRVGYAEMDRAFHAAAGTDTEAGSVSHRLKVWLGRYLSGARFSFDRQGVVEQLRDYLFAQNTSERLRLLDNPAGGDANLGVRRKVDREYGTDIYAGLHRYVQIILESGQQVSPIPWRILWEHKMCMLLRTRFMAERGYLDPCRSLAEECAALAASAETLHLMMLKFSMRPTAPLMARARARLHAIAESEAALLQRLLGALEVG